MKSILSISGCALILILNHSSALALSAEKQAPLSPESTALGTEPTAIAGIFDILNSTIKVTTGAMEMIHQQKQRNHELRVQEAKEQERQQRLAQEQRLREQESEYKMALLKLQFREAERRRQEYLLLGQAERAAYLAEQQGKQEIEAILFLELIDDVVADSPVLPASTEAAALSTTAIASETPSEQSAPTSSAVAP